MNKLSAERQKELRKIAGTPDREINLSEIPEIREIPSDAVIGRSYRPGKTKITIQLDDELVVWLKASGSEYQTRINFWLREYMRQALRRV